MKCDALNVMKRWGFQYKSTYYWLKPGYGTGYWSTRDQIEELLVGTRGRVPAPALGTQPPQTQCFPQGKHSEKPAKFAAMIEATFPTARNLRCLRARVDRVGMSGAMRRQSR